jgi:hypothetical protein
VPRFEWNGLGRVFSPDDLAPLGRAPAMLLAGDWDPDDEGPGQVRQLARELVSFSAT